MATMMIITTTMAAITAALVACLLDAMLRDRAALFNLDSTIEPRSGLVNEPIA